MDTQESHDLSVASVEETLQGGDDGCVLSETAASPSLDRNTSVKPSVDRTDTFSILDLDLTTFQRYVRNYFGSDNVHMVDKDQEQVMTQAVHHRVIRKELAVKYLKRRQRIKDVMISAMAFIIMMFVVFYVYIDQYKIFEVYELEASIKNYVTSLHFVDGATAKTLRDVHNLTGVWSWLQEAYLPALFPIPQWYNGEPFTDSETGYFLQYNRVFGGIELVQQRVDACQCVDDESDAEEISDANEDDRHVSCSMACPRRFNDFYPTLWPKLSKRATSRAPYGPIIDPYKYTFNDGGFTILMPPDRKLVNHIIQELKADRWLDKHSRSLTATFNAYNGALKMFTVFTLHFVFGVSGMVSSDLRATTFRLEHYSDSGDMARFAGELLIFMFVMLQLMSELSGIYHRRAGEANSKFRPKEYLWSLENWIDNTRIALFLTSIYWWFARIVFHPEAVGLELPLPPGVTFYDLSGLVSSYNVLTTLYVSIILLCLLTIFAYMARSPVYGIIVRTIVAARYDLMQYAIMFGVCFLVFAVIGVLLFGHILKEWKSVHEAGSTLVMMMTGEYGMEPLKQVSNKWGIVFYSLFLILIFFLLVNILLAILMDSYANLKSQNQKEDEETEGNLRISVMGEFLLQARFCITWAAHKIINRRIQHRNFITNERMLEMLADTKQLDHVVTLLPVKATLKDPNPLPVTIIKYPELSSVFTEKREAQLLMMAVGTEIDSCEELIRDHFRSNNVGTEDEIVSPHPAHQNDSEEYPLQGIQVKMQEQIQLSLADQKERIAAMQQQQTIFMEQQRALISALFSSPAAAEYHAAVQYKRKRGDMAKPNDFCLKSLG